MYLRPRTRAVLTCFVISLVCASPVTGAGAARDPFQPHVIRELNAVRAQYGLPPLRSDRALGRAAQRQTDAQIGAGRLSHRDAKGRGVAERLRLGQGPPFVVGETIAFVPADGGPAAKWAVSAWMRSSTHRRQVLRRAFARAGVGSRVGVMDGAPGVLLTVDFASAT